MSFLFENGNLITEGKLLYYGVEREAWQILSVYYKTLFSNNHFSLLFLSSILRFFPFHFFGCPNM
jgi:hypothetical protein